MSKLHFGFGVAITLLFSMMAFSLFIAPALANSSQVTIIGGATNGNIFGSVQLDELNITSTGVIRSDGGAGPTIITVTYPTGWAWNSTWAQTNVNIDSGTITDVTLSGTMTGTPTWASGQTMPTLNTGQGANELFDMDQNVLQASTPTFAGLTSNGNIDLTNDDLINIDKLLSDTDTAMTIQGNHDNGDALYINGARLSASAGSCLYIRSNNDVDAMTTRVVFSCGVATSVAAWSDTTHTGIVLSGDIRINSGISIASGGGGNPDIVTFTYPATTSWNGTWTHDFNSAAVNNLGAAGNDFGATNTLVGTTFSGSIDMGAAGANSVVNVNSLQGHDGGINSLLIVGANTANQRDILILTTDGVPASTLRLTFGSNTPTVNITMSASHMIPAANNTLALGHNDVRWANIWSVVNTAKSQVTGDINFEGAGLDWTLIETGILGDKYKGLVLIDKPTIVNGKWVFPENYRRIFEVNEQGVFHLGNQLAYNNQISDLQSQINDLKQEIEILKGS